MVIEDFVVNKFVVLSFVDSVLWLVDTLMLAVVIFVLWRAEGGNF